MPREGIHVDDHTIFDIWYSGSHICVVITASVHQRCAVSVFYDYTFPRVVVGRCSIRST